MPAASLQLRPAALGAGAAKVQLTEEQMVVVAREQAAALAKKAELDRKWVSGLGSKAFSKP